jgi:peroxiredoxin
MNIPAEKQEQFRARSQSNYPLLFDPDRRTAESLLTMLAGKRDDR